MSTETHNIADILSGVKGTAFTSIDTLTKEDLYSRLSSLTPEHRMLCSLMNVKSNPMIGRIFKKLVGNSVIVFTSSAGYRNMVKRRLEVEGKNPDDFVVKPPIWGTRIADTPIIEHNGEHYLEVVFQKPGRKSYLGMIGSSNKLEEIEKDVIFGLKKPAKIADSAQAYLENMVILRRYKLSSITGIRFDGKEFTGKFVYSPVVATEEV